MKCVNLPFAWFPRTSHCVSVSQHKSEGFFLSPPPQNREGRGTEAGWMSKSLNLHTKYKIKFIFIPSGLHAQTQGSVHAPKQKTDGLISPGTVQPADLWVHCWVAAFPRKTLIFLSLVVLGSCDLSLSPQLSGDIAWA